MPSIPSNLISLDTSMALLALRLVAYHLPEENLCPGLLTAFRICTKSLGYLHLQGLYIAKQLQD